MTDSWFGLWEARPTQCVSVLRSKNMRVVHTEGVLGSFPPRVFVLTDGRAATDAPSAYTCRARSTGADRSGSSCPVAGSSIGAPSSSVDSGTACISAGTALHKSGEGTAPARASAPAVGAREAGSAATRSGVANRS